MSLAEIWSFWIGFWTTAEGIFPPHAFCRCMDMVDELESDLSGAGPALTTNVE